MPKIILELNISPDMQTNMAAIAKLHLQGLLDSVFDNIPPMADLTSPLGTKENATLASCALPDDPSVCSGRIYLTHEAFDPGEKLVYEDNELQNVSVVEATFSSDFTEKKVVARAGEEVFGRNEQNN